MTAPFRPLADLLPLVLPHALNCPDLVASFNLRQAAIELCEKSHCWRHMLEAEATPQGPVVVIPYYTAIHKIEDATFNDCPLTPIAYTDVSQQMADETGTPRFISQTAPGSLSLIPYPDCEGTLTVSAFLKPTQGRKYEQDASGRLIDFYDIIPDFMYDQYGETLAEGALARLLLQKETEWYDPKQAMYYRDRFEARAASSQMASYAGQQRAKARTKPSFF